MTLGYLTLNSPNKLGNRLTGFLSSLQSGQANDLRTGNYKEASDIVSGLLSATACIVA